MCVWGGGWVRNKTFQVRIADLVPQLFSATASQHSSGYSKPVCVSAQNVPRAAAAPPMSIFMVFILFAVFKLSPPVSYVTP